MGSFSIWHWLIVLAVVLLVFGVMLTASGHTVKIQASPAEMLLGAGVGLLLLFVMLFSIGSVDWGDVSGRMPVRVASPAELDEREDERLDALVLNGTSPAIKAAAEQTRADALAQRQQGRTVRQLGLSFFGLRPDRNLNQASGAPLAPGFLLPFEIVSVHLLVVLVGAAYLARAKRRVNSSISSGE